MKCFTFAVFRIVTGYCKVEKKIYVYVQLCPRFADQVSLQIKSEWSWSRPTHFLTFRGLFKNWRENTEMCSKIEVISIQVYHIFIFLFSMSRFFGWVCLPLPTIKKRCYGFVSYIFTDHHALIFYFNVH